MDIPIEKRRQFIDISLLEIERANDIIKSYLTAKPAPEEYEVMDIKNELNRAIDLITPLANMNCVEVLFKLLRCSMVSIIYKQKLP